MALTQLYVNFRTLFFIYFQKANAIRSYVNFNICKTIVMVSTKDHTMSSPKNVYIFYFRLIMSKDEKLILRNLHYI